MKIADISDCELMHRVDMLMSDQVDLCEIILWCEQNLGHQEVFGPVCDVWSYYDFKNKRQHTPRISWYFARENDAVPFRLTWI